MVETQQLRITRTDGQEVVVEALKEDTEKFYFKHVWEEGGKNAGNFNEAVLGFYKKAIDNAGRLQVLIFYSTSKAKNGQYYYPVKHYVMKDHIAPYLELQSNSRYGVRIKHLKEHDLTNTFTIKEI